jgi:hypothetical protein
MIQSITQWLGGIVLLLGILYALYLFASAKLKATFGPILDAVKSFEKQTGFDVPLVGDPRQPGPDVTTTANPRLQALEDAEALLRHFEAEKNAAGVTALQSVVAALFSKPQ